MDDVLGKIEKLLTDLNIQIDQRIDIVDVLKTKPVRIQRIFYLRAQGYTWEEIAAKEKVSCESIVRKYFNRNVRKNEFQYIVLLSRTGEGK